MLKRATWAAAGFVAGLSASKWLERKARRQLERYLPGGRMTIETTAAAKAKALRAARTGLFDLRQAVGEGREAMVGKQDELRHQLRLVKPTEDGPA